MKNVQKTLREERQELTRAVPEGREGTVNGKLEKRIFYRVGDVAELLSVSVPTAYKVIRQLNQELERQGCYIIPGRVSRAYFNQKYGYGEYPAKH